MRRKEGEESLVLAERVGRRVEGEEDGEVLRRLGAVERCLLEGKGLRRGGGGREGRESSGMSEGRDVRGVCRTMEAREGLEGRDSSEANMQVGTRAVKPRRRHGRMLKSGSGSRYVDGGIWPAVEVAFLQDSDRSTPIYHCAPAVATWPLSGPALQDLTHLHPATERIFPLWQVYLENVNPLLRILHVPTTQRQLLQASGSLAGIPPSFEALMFAIYYAAVASMQSSVPSQSHAERMALLDKHGTGVEQALSKASFMASPPPPDMFALQALVIYLLCARASGHRSAELVWSMTGIATQLARRLGLHCDTSRLGVSPFEAEMNSRLWWYVVVLDTMAAQDMDLDPSISDSDPLPPLPHNIDDQMLEPAMTRPVRNSDQRTEMVFGLRLIDLTRLARSVLFPTAVDMPHEAKLAQITSLRSRLEEHDHDALDTNTALCSFVRSATEIELSRLLTAVHILQRAESASPAETGENVREGAANDASSQADHPGGRHPNAISGNALAALQHLHCAQSSPTAQRRFLWFVQRSAEYDSVLALLYSLGIGLNFQGGLASDETRVAQVRREVDEFFARRQQQSSPLGSGEGGGGAWGGDRRWGMLKALYAEFLR